MDNSEKEFSPQDSIALIRSMIETTKHSISDSSHYFLLWGWTTMIACVIQYVLLVIVKYEHHYYAWFLTFVAAIIHIIFGIKDSKKSTVKTFISEANESVWMAIGFAFMALAFVFAKIGYQYCFPIYILIYGLGTFISGRLIKFKPLVYGGAACFLLVTITPFLNYSLQILMAALAILVSYIIPGHLLRAHYRKNKTV